MWAAAPEPEMQFPDTAQVDTAVLVGPEANTTSLNFDFSA